MGNHGNVIERGQRSDAAQLLLQPACVVPRLPQRQLNFELADPLLGCVQFVDQATLFGTAPHA